MANISSPHVSSCLHIWILVTVLDILVVHGTAAEELLKTGGDLGEIAAVLQAFLFFGSISTFC